VHDGLCLVGIECCTFTHDFGDVNKTATHDQIGNTRSCIVAPSDEPRCECSCCDFFAGAIWPYEEIRMRWSLG
jgi:hypothetical protein